MSKPDSPAVLPPVPRPASTGHPRRPAVAIVGAGVAGLTLAHRLASQGVSVLLLDKSRGPGGRCATRQTPAGAFDHGPGTVQAVGEAFGAAIAALPDPAALGLNAWARRLGAAVTGGTVPSGLETRWNATVAALEPAPSDGPDDATGRESPAEDLATPGPSAPRWMLRLAPPTASPPGGAAAQSPLFGRLALAARPPATRIPPAPGTPEIEAERLGPFDAVIVAAPAEQARTLLQPSLHLAAALREVASQPCWTLMAAWPGELPAVHRLALGPEPAGAGAAGLPALPAVLAEARPMTGAPAGRWVVHATADWSAANLEATPDSVAQHLLAAFEARAGVRLARPSWHTVHRWRYAQVAVVRPEAYGWDGDLRLGAVGDAWGGTGAAGAQGVERAWRSAQALADAWLLGALPGDQRNQPLRAK